MLLDINPWEFAIVALLALILVGPSRLPAVARQAARWLKAARQLYQDVSARVKEEVGDDPLVQELGSLGVGRTGAAGATRSGAAGVAGRLLGVDGEPAPHGQPRPATGEKHWDSEAT